MPSRYIAGHDMADGIGGLACLSCGRTWLSLLDQRHRWRPGEVGIAHEGALNQAEVDSLERELDRIWRATVG